MDDHIVIDGVSYHGQCYSYEGCSYEERDSCIGCQYHGPAIDPYYNKPIPSDSCICAARCIGDCACGAWYFKEEGYE